MGAKESSEKLDACVVPGPTLVLPSGNPAPVTCSSSERVADLRARLATAIGAPSGSIRLAFGPDLLQDNQTLESFTGSTVSVLVSCYVQLPELLSPRAKGEVKSEVGYHGEGVASTPPGTFSQVGPLIDGITEQQLRENYAHVVYSVASGLADDCREQWTCRFLRYGARFLGLDLFYVVIPGFQSIEWSGFVTLALESMDKLGGILTAVEALAPESVGKLAGSLTAVGGDQVSDVDLERHDERVVSGLRCTPFRCGGIRKRGRRGWEDPVTDSSQNIEVTQVVASAIWQAARRGKLQDVYGEAATLALLLIQHQRHFSSDATIPEILRSSEGDGEVLRRLRVMFSSRAKEALGQRCDIDVFGEIPSSVADPKHEVRCDGQWFSGHPPTAAHAADFAVRVSLTCCVDFGGAYWSSGSARIALLDARLEVLGPSLFQLTTSTIASAECRGVALS